MMTLLFILSLIANVMLATCFTITWRRYWMFVTNIDANVSRLRQHYAAIKKLSQREILSNDITVMAFVKHIAAANDTLNVIFDKITIETEPDENDQEKSEEEAQV